MTENETDTETTEWPLFEEVSKRCDVRRDFPKLLKTIEEHSCGIVTAHRNYPTKRQRRAMARDDDGWGVLQEVQEIEERNVSLNQDRQERLVEQINEARYKRIEIRHICGNIVEGSLLIWPTRARRGRDEPLLRFLKDLSKKFNQKSFYFLPYQSPPIMYDFRDGQWVPERKRGISTLIDFERVLQEHKQVAYRDLPGPKLPSISACEVVKLSDPIHPILRSQRASPSMAKAMFYRDFHHKIDVMDFLSSIERERHLTTLQYETLFDLLEWAESSLSWFTRSLINLRYRKRNDVGEDAE